MTAYERYLALKSLKDNAITAFQLDLVINGIPVPPELEMILSPLLRAELQQKLTAAIRGEKAAAILEFDQRIETARAYLELLRTEKQALQDA